MSANSPTAIMTVSGRYFDPINPRAEDVDLDDIAVALGRIVRFNGHTKRPITVAEHSMRVARIAARMVSQRHASPGLTALIILLALLHDSAEAFIGDIVSPIKTDEMREVEARILDVIVDAVLGIPIALLVVEAGDPREHSNRNEGCPLNRWGDLSPGRCTCGDQLATDAVRSNAWQIVKQADEAALYFEAMLWQRGAEDWAARIGNAGMLKHLPDIVGERGDDWQAQVIAARDMCLRLHRDPSPDVVVWPPAKAGA